MNKVAQDIKKVITNYLGDTLGATFFRVSVEKIGKNEQNFNVDDVNKFIGVIKTDTALTNLLGNNWQNILILEIEKHISKGKTK